MKRVCWKCDDTGNLLDGDDYCTCLLGNKRRKIFENSKQKSLRRWQCSKYIVEHFSETLRDLGWFYNLVTREWRKPNGEIVSEIWVIQHKEEIVQSILREI